MLAQSYGALLRTFRTNRKKRLDDVARIAGIDASYLSRIERAERAAPTEPIQKAIAAALQLSEEEKRQLNHSKEAGLSKALFLATPRRGEVIVMRMTTKDAAQLFGEKIVRQAAVLLAITPDKETSM